MKKFVNIYSYRKTYETSGDNPISHNSFLHACYPKRDYPTKMKIEDLPEYYCDVHRYNMNYNVISSKDIVDMSYSWVPENHFMKDSLLRISYTGKIEPYDYEFEYDYEGKKIKTSFKDYRNVDALVFGNEIFKFLAYAHKYSGYELTKIREEFKNQCEWLEKNEPAFAPDLNDSKDYGEWFDKKINSYYDR